VRRGDGKSWKFVESSNRQTEPHLIKSLGKWSIPVCAGRKSKSVPNCPILSIQALQSRSQFPKHERQTVISSPRHFFELILYIFAQYIQYTVKPRIPSMMPGAILDLMRSRSELVLENTFLQRRQIRHGIHPRHIRRFLKIHARLQRWQRSLHRRLARTRMPRKKQSRYYMHLRHSDSR
jgi:hypothetical protein